MEGIAEAARARSILSRSAAWPYSGTVGTMKYRPAGQLMKAEVQIRDLGYNLVWPGVAPRTHACSAAIARSVKRSAVST